MRQYWRETPEDLKGATGGRRGAGHRLDPRAVELRRELPGRVYVFGVYDARVRHHARADASSGTRRPAAGVAAHDRRRASRRLGHSRPAGGAGRRREHGASPVWTHVPRVRAGAALPRAGHAMSNMSLGEHGAHEHRVRARGDPVVVWEQAGHGRAVGAGRGPGGDHGFTDANAFASARTVPAPALARDEAGRAGEHAR